MSYIVLTERSEKDLEVLANGLFAATFLPMKAIKFHCNVKAYLHFTDDENFRSVISVKGKLHSDQVLIEQLGDNYVGYIEKKITKKFVKECHEINAKIRKAQHNIADAKTGAFPKFDELFGLDTSGDCAAALDTALKAKEAVPKLLVRGF